MMTMTRDATTKTDSPVLIAAVMLVLILLVYLTVRFAFLPPASRDTLLPLDVQVSGKMRIPPDAGLMKAGESRSYLPGLLAVFEMPEVPLRIEKRGREILFSPSGELSLQLGERSVQRIPRSMNVRFSLGDREYRRTDLAVPPMPCSVNLSDIVMRARAKPGSTLPRRSSRHGATSEGAE